jgi:hypothetical protein
MTDKLIDPQGNVREVLRCLPGGKLDMLDRKRTRFGMFLHREVKYWPRGEK